MTLCKIEHGALVPIYLDTGNSKGFYKILPGYPSYICLNKSLLEGSAQIHQFVYDTLLNYHDSIPSDSKMRVFKHTCYFEELVNIPALELPKPEVIVIGRAFRVWRFNLGDDRIRVIGNPG